MGFGGISIWQLLIVLAIVILIFGTKRLKNIGSDVGGAVKGFKDAVSEDKSSTEDDASKQQQKNIDEQEHSPTTEAKKEENNN